MAVLRQKRFFSLQDFTRHIPKLSDMDYDIKSFNYLQPGKDHAINRSHSFIWSHTGIQQKIDTLRKGPNFQTCLLQFKVYHTINHGFKVALRFVTLMTDSLNSFVISSRKNG